MIYGNAAARCFKAVGLVLDASTPKVLPFIDHVFSFSGVLATKGAAYASVREGEVPASGCGHEIVSAINSGRPTRARGEAETPSSLSLDKLFHYSAEFGNVNIARTTDGHAVSSPNSTSWKG